MTRGSLAGVVLAFALAAAGAHTAGAEPAPSPDDPSVTASAATDGGVTKHKKKKHKKKRKKKKRKKKKHAPATWTLSHETSAEVLAGALSGETTLPESGAVTAVEVKTRPELEKGVWRVQGSVRAGHEEVVGASLSETSGAIGAELRYRRGPRLRVSVDAGVSGRWRPDWPDLYQPMADGSLMTTDRYSRWTREVGVELAGIPLRHQHARLEYGYELHDYQDDPSFEPIDAPTHLVPGDGEVHKIEGSWKYLTGPWKAGGGVDTAIENSFFAFARDAGTGATHAGAGGAPPNPLEQIVNVEPYVLAEWGKAKSNFEVDLKYGVEVAVDTFQGYYSYVGHHPEIGIELRPNTATELKAHAELWLRRYGPDSYAEGGTHPPLAYGDRRVDRRFTGKLEGERAFGDRWSVFAEGRITIRRTNFPAYEPGVFPASRMYDIDWNYTNLRASLGVRAKL